MKIIEYNLYNINNRLFLCLLLVLLSFNLINPGKSFGQNLDDRNSVLIRDVTKDEFISSLAFFPLEYFNETVTIDRFPNKSEYYKILNDLPWEFRDKSIYSDYLSWIPSDSCLNGKLKVKKHDGTFTSITINQDRLIIMNDISFSVNLYKLNKNDINRYHQRQFMIDMLNKAHQSYILIYGNIPKNINQLEDLLGVNLKTGFTYDQYGFVIKFNVEGVNSDSFSNIIMITDDKWLNEKGLTFDLMGTDALKTELNNLIRMN